MKVLLNNLVLIKDKVRATGLHITYYIWYEDRLLLGVNENMMEGISLLLYLYRMPKTSFYIIIL